MAGLLVCRNEFIKYRAKVSKRNQRIKKTLSTVLLDFHLDNTSFLKFAGLALHFFPRRFARSHRWLCWIMGRFRQSVRFPGGKFAGLHLFFYFTLINIGKFTINIGNISAHFTLVHYKQHWSWATRKRWLENHLNSIELLSIIITLRVGTRPIAMGIDKNIWFLRTSKIEFNILLQIKITIIALVINF